MHLDCWKSNVSHAKQACIARCPYCATEVTGGIKRVFLTEGPDSPVAVGSQPSGHVEDPITVDSEEEDRCEDGACSSKSKDEHLASTGNGHTGVLTLRHRATGMYSTVTETSCVQNANEVSIPTDIGQMTSMSSNWCGTVCAIEY
jgi:hypothetical protein